MDRRSTMQRRTSLTSLQQISEINLTPLMDLTFILLITFIITFPLIEQGITVNLPKGRADELDESSSRTITLDTKGNLYLDRARTDKTELAREMGALGRADPTTAVFLRADQDIRYGRVAGILKILHDAGLSRVALVTEAGGDEGGTLRRGSGQARKAEGGSKRKNAE